MVSEFWGGRELEVFSDFSEPMDDAREVFANGADLELLAELVRLAPAAQHGKSLLAAFEKAFEGRALPTPRGRGRRKERWR